MRERDATGLSREKDVAASVDGMAGRHLGDDIVDPATDLFYHLVRMANDLKAQFGMIRLQVVAHAGRHLAHLDDRVGPAGCGNTKDPIDDVVQDDQSTFGTVKMGLIMKECVSGLVMPMNAQLLTIHLGSVLGSQAGWTIHL